MNASMTSMTSMKRKAITVTALVLAALTLCGCGVTPDAPDTGSIAHTSANDTSADSDNTALTTDIVTSEEPVTEPGELVIGSDMLGLVPAVIRGTGASVVTSLEPDGSVRLIAKAAGTEVLTVLNEYSEAATVTVTVDASLKVAADCEKFAPEGKSVTVTDFGAKGNGTANDTEAIQKAIDSLADGGTVYIPAGIYRISYLEFRKGIHIRLAGCLEDASVGYNEKTAAYVKSGKVAILRRDGTNSHMFYNLKRGGYCTEGVSDISLSGGVLDCTKTGMAMVWACADGVLFENCIVKDISNNHAIQIDGCRNVTVRNVMFAGYTLGSSPVLTRETIQIEPTTPGALSSNPQTTPVKCNAGDFRYNKNIVITGCYFGKSDVSGAHLTPVGHHSTNGQATCDGFEFSQNTVDNPLMYGLHIVNFINIKITGNTFISDKKTDLLADDSAFVNFYSKTADLSYTDSFGDLINYSTKTEQDGIKNADVSDNSFILGGDTNMRVLCITGTDFRPGAAYRSLLKRVAVYGEKYSSYSGYVPSENLIAGVRFRNNTVTVCDSTGYHDYLFYVKKVQNFTFEGNSVSGGLFSAKNGLVTTGIVSEADSRSRTVDARSGVASVIYIGNGTGYEKYSCRASGNLVVSVRGKGNILLTYEGIDIKVTPEAEAGWVFDGWKTSDGTAVDFSAGFSGVTGIIAVFREK